ITIVSAMGLSVLVALVLTPALTATLLKRKDKTKQASWLDRKTSAASEWFNTGFDRMVTRYGNAVSRVVDRKWLFLLIYAGV
ncbi:efflux RND transporter permease subunit, partial [Listeria monocytogenes]|nr:efflux RND transporter permease subunit [Listeria monocytogenes]